jgi:excisionase family DNA binding protein
MEEVAELTGIPINTLRYWRHNNYGPASYKVGRRVRYDADEVARFMEAQRTAGTGGAA